MLYRIENDLLKIDIETLGAEIKSIIYKNTNYIHDSNPKYWNRSAPILWPNIGTIKGEQAIIEGISYPMKRHGFLREQEFKLLEKTSDSIKLYCESTDETKKMYPYSWRVDISYEVIERTLKSIISITNTSNKRMPFNIGLHPAFHIPLENDKDFEDYQIVFKNPGDYEIPTINLNDGTIDFTKTTKRYRNLKELDLNYEDYNNDALIFDNITCSTIKLSDKDNSHGVYFSFPRFKTLAVWTTLKTKAPFICLEPWNGCADTSKHNSVFTEKKDLIWLDTNGTETYRYTIEVF